MGQLWQAVQNWLGLHQREFWIGLGVLACVWAVVGLVMEYRWQREKDGKVLFGYPFGWKVAWAVVTLLLLLGIVVGLTHLLGQVGGLAAAGAFPLLLLVWAGACVFLIAFTLWLCRAKRLEIDLAKRTWRLERGWAFAPESREGGFDAMKGLLLEREVTWHRVIWRISVIWNEGVRPFVLFERRLKRLPLPGRLLLSLMGKRGVSAIEEQMVQKAAVKRLHEFEDKLGLSTSCEPKELSVTLHGNGR